MPVIIFGEGAGMIGGDHKDSSISSAIVTTSLGSDTRLYVRSPLVNVTLLRFSFAGHIPTNAIVNTSVLSLTINQNLGPANISIHRLITNWGITNIDEGITQTPAVLGQATFRRSFDFNGAGGDVNWGGGGNFTIADYIAAEDSIVFPGVGLVKTWDIPIMTEFWINDDNTNFGAALISDGIADNRFSSQEAGVPAVRPYLTVDYTVPDDAVRRVVKGSMGLNQNSMSL